MIDYEKLLAKLNGLPWRGILVATAVAFLLASVLSNVISMLLIPPPPVAQRVLPDGATNDLPSGSLTITDSDIKKICDRNLFDHEASCPGLDETPDTDDVIGPELAKSDLPVDVVGIIYGGTPFNGLATILNTQKNKINSFIVGDLLIQDAQVEEIRRTRVILKRQGGRREYIELQQPEIRRNKRKKGRSSPQPSQLNTVSPLAKGPPPKTFSEEGFERVGNEMKMTQQYKEQILSPANFSKVLQDAKATPNIVDGQVRGFRVTRIREGSVYQKAGLQDDDVIEEINGEPLNNAASAIRTLQAVRNETEIEVLVNRGGTSMLMRLTVQ